MCVCVWIFKICTIHSDILRRGEKSKGRKEKRKKIEER